MGRIEDLFKVVFVLREEERCIKLRRWRSSRV